MDTRTQFLLQLLSKLGAPLMAAVNTHSAGGEGGQKDAAVIASLLSESVKISISLSQAMNLKPDDGDADAIRVALAALAGGLVADTYRQTGRVPGESEGRRISKALESVIVFADNFAPAAEHAQRLQTLEGAPPFFDAVQTNIYTIHGLLPAIAAIGEFSFGQSDTSLIQDVANRIAAKSKDLQRNLLNGGNTMSELVVLQALGQIYASSHRAETARLRAAGDDQGTASLKDVWASFDKQVAMLEILLGSMAGSERTSSSGSSSVKPSMEMPAAETPAAAPPPLPASTGQAGSSPMSFFKKK